MSAMHGGVEEVVRRLLERSQHQHRLSHLGNPEARDAQHLSLKDFKKKNLISLVEYSAVLV